MFIYNFIAQVLILGPYGLVWPIFSQVLYASLQLQILSSFLCDLPVEDPGSLMVMFATVLVGFADCRVAVLFDMCLCPIFCQLEVEGEAGSKLGTVPGLRRPAVC